MSTTLRLGAGSPRPPRALHRARPQRSPLPAAQRPLSRLHLVHPATRMPSRLRRRMPWLPPGPPEAKLPTGRCPCLASLGSSRALRTTQLKSRRLRPRSLRSPERTSSPTARLRQSWTSRTALATSRRRSRCAWRCALSRAHLTSSALSRRRACRPPRTRGRL